MKEKKIEDEIWFKEMRVAIWELYGEVPSRNEIMEFRTEVAA